VDDRDVGDGDALWKGHEDVAPSLGANGRAFRGGASARSEAWESLNKQQYFFKSHTNARLQTWSMSFHSHFGKLREFNTTWKSNPS
jgi:hypothetical protein